MLQGLAIHFVSETNECETAIHDADQFARLDGQGNSSFPAEVDHGGAEFCLAGENLIRAAVVMDDTHCKTEIPVMLYNGRV